ncbi:hypothetical protein [Streptomyces sp. NPDC005548]|uniref:hypothetical protein n=1 Tax=Streptomyces sp. NPDC005548 TaxID=3364724 RepID=UPI003685C677
MATTGIYKPSSPKQMLPDSALRKLSTAWIESDRSGGGTPSVANRPEVYVQGTGPRATNGEKSQVINRMPKFRTGILGAAVLTLAAAGLTEGAGSASASTAAPTFHNVCKSLGGGEYEDIVYDQNGNYSGLALFEANGDKMQAVDPRSDGYYVTALLDVGTQNIRQATTNGHGTYSPWATGDLPEGHTYFMWVDMTIAGTNSGVSLGGCNVKS